MVQTFHRFYSLRKYWNNHVSTLVGHNFTAERSKMPKPLKIFRSELLCYNLIFFSTFMTIFSGSGCGPTIPPVLLRPETLKRTGFDSHWAYVYCRTKLSKNSIVRCIFTLKLQRKVMSACEISDLSVVDRVSSSQQLQNTQRLSKLCHRYL